MDTFDAIYARRAIKHYDPNHTMPEADLKKLFEAAIQSPSSFNIQQWRFVVMRDKELRRQLRAAGNDQAQITDASILGRHDGRPAGLEEGSAAILARCAAGGGGAAGQLDGAVLRRPRLDSAGRGNAFDGDRRPDDHAGGQGDGVRLVPDDRFRSGAGSRVDQPAGRSRAWLDDRGRQGGQAGLAEAGAIAAGRGDGLRPVLRPFASSARVEFLSLARREVRLSTSMRGILSATGALPVRS